MTATIVMPQSDQRFPKALRLTKQADFDAVFQQGRYAADGCLVIHARPNNLPHSRIGLSISKKVGNAPTRNRWKRLIREAFRTQRLDLPTGIDFVVRPKRGAVPEFHAIRKSLVNLLRRLNHRLQLPETSSNQH